MADYTLQQLAAETGVTPRTVRYYVAQGLLPSPGAGPGTRYTDTHLERLRLIKQLQRAHLPLAEIRTHINRGSALDYVQRVLGGDARPSQSEPSRQMFALAIPSAPSWIPAPRAAIGRSVPAPAQHAAPPQPDRSQWDRVSLTPDVELHVRRPLTRDQNRRVDRLIAAARDLFEEEQP